MVAKGRFAMRPGITARRDYDAARLRGLARTTKSASQGRRLLALAEIYDGGSRTKAACVGGGGLQTIRDWVLRFNAHGPEGLADRQAPGHPGKLNTVQRQALAAMVESGPMPAIHGVVRWRLKDLAMWVWEEFRVSVSETTLSRILRALGYRKLSARPRHHAQAAGAVDAFKKRSPSAWMRSRATRGSNRDRIEVWFGDEARIGQKNKITRRWARRGTRPSAPHDQRTASTYIFGAICPGDGKGRLTPPHLVGERLSHGRNGRSLVPVPSVPRFIRSPPPSFDHLVDRQSRKPTRATTHGQPL